MENVSSAGNGILLSNGRNLREHVNSLTSPWRRRSKNLEIFDFCDGTSLGLGPIRVSSRQLPTLCRSARVVLCRGWSRQDAVRPGVTRSKEKPRIATELGGL
jgi:hypothetical protein